MTIRVL